jgi:1-acyl-sn-glycerol-3-phosphate acyltransferase
LYCFLKILARLALRLFCRHIQVGGKDILQKKGGPLLIVANHPNAFLDAVVVASRCRAQTYTLVRGDVFQYRWSNRALRALFCIPIFRIQEGKQRLHHNENSFQDCLRRFDEGKNVLIFAEGDCENEWKLRPLGKGAARLALQGWQHTGGKLRVVPLGITYQDFKGLGKKVLLAAGTPLPMEGFQVDSPRDVLLVKRLLHRQLERHIVEVPPGEEPLRNFQKWMEDMGTTEKKHSRSPWISRLTTLPALLGWLLHAPLYYPLKKFTQKQTAGTVYYDSVLFGLLFLGYPLYLLLTAMVLYLGTGCLVAAIGWMLVLPALVALTVRHPLFNPYVPMRYTAA